MRLNFRQFSSCCATGAGILCLLSWMAIPGRGQELEPRASANLEATIELPEAPRPQPSVVDNPLRAEWSSSQQGSSSSAKPAETEPTTQPQSVPPSTQKSQKEIAEDQLKQEKKQRIGILPNFNASYIDNAVPLTPGQKFRLMFSTEKDPATIGFSMFVALIGQAEGSHDGYGGGIGGYGKRFGQNYADTFDGAFWGNAVLPSLWHQDPRYFRMGHGKVSHRIFYALSTNIRAKHDGTGKWEPNYSNLVGNVIAGGISNLYLPKDERGVASTFEGAATVTAEGGIGSMLEEFWPDYIHYLQRRKQRKLAAKMAAEDKVEPAPQTKAAPKP